MKKILQISLMALLVAGTLILVSFADRAHNAQRYKSFVIDVLNPSENALINEKEIREMVTSHFGTVEGTSISVIHLDEMENLARNNPYISTCEVFQTIDGMLVMKVLVRSPLVRIINDNGQQYFIDYAGYMVPVSFNHPSHVVVANGNIPDRYISIDKSEKSIKTLPHSSILHQIYDVSLLINRDDFLKAFIDQIYVNDMNEMELVLKVGNHEIIFGSAENAREKLENLKTFYVKVMSRMDWNTYKRIILKYNNQVVCSK